MINYLKALHIIFVVTWFAGMFYMPRLFIYNTEANDKPIEAQAILHDQFTIMMKRLWYGITVPSALLTLIFGPLVMFAEGWNKLLLDEAGRWLLIKLIFVLFLYVYFISMHLIFKQQLKGVFKYTSQQLRLWNEVATIFLVAIVMLAVVKQAISLVWGLGGLIVFIIVLMIAIFLYKKYEIKTLLQSNISFLFLADSCAFRVLSLLPTFAQILCMQLIEELSWRGLIQDIMPGTEEQLNKEMTSGYIGFDPTANSLHIGSLVPIILLVHLQKSGHKPYVLIGGATGMVGDPSGKSEERNLLTDEVLQHNQQGIKKQLQQFLDFNESKANAAVMVNNYDWFKEINFLHFIRDVGKYITVNYMMAKDSVRKRIEGESGISFTEFTYQLIQGYDFFWLYTHHNCKLQMGGSDQWGNITTGTELIRRKAGGEAFAFTCPLLTKADGGKFGKTESGNIWLDAAKTSAYQFYQFWLNAADEDVKKWIKIFTFLSKEDIDALTAQHEANAAARILQKTLAKELTIFVHGEAGYNDAITTTEKLFANQNNSAESLTVQDLEGMEGVTKFTFDKHTIEASIDVVSFLAESGIFSSKGEAKKMIQSGGVSINRKKVDTIQTKIDATFLLHDKYLLVQKGKKNYYLIKAE